jgi:uncharacterized protein YecE (DUF72 family)
MSMAAGRWFIGTAGWCIPRTSAFRFEGQGTHLQRYARVLRCAEINSSFHRPHAEATYAKWAASTPQEFRFSVKLPKAITHEQKLRRARPLLQRFLGESAALGSKRGPLLVQLPPSLTFEGRAASRFFDLLRTLFEGDVVCEPRHASWWSQGAESLLVRCRIARVAADPPPAKDGEHPGGWNGIRYYRLHGSPRKYWSAYSDEYMDRLGQALCSAPRDSVTWCVFDNTASGAALENAWHLHTRLTRHSGRDEVPRQHQNLKPEPA